jgi:hypothetical protein
MTEEQWLASSDPGPMVAHLWAQRPATRQSARRLRLLGCACVRAVWPLLGHAGSRDAVAVAERYADGEATADDLWTARISAMAAFSASPFSAHWHAAEAAQHLTVKNYNGGASPSYAQAVRSAAAAWAMDRVRSGAGLVQEIEVRARQAVHADWARDVFGNPFRPVFFSPEWRTDTAVTLARQMYEAREFSALPILADALQDVGCDDEHILSHCRDTAQPHVRGCWVVDLVLGKQ